MPPVEIVFLIRRRHFSKYMIVKILLLFFIVTSPSFAQMSGEDMFFKSQELEGKLKSLTAHLENLELRNRDLEQELKKVTADYEFRLKELEQTNISLSRAVKDLKAADEKIAAEKKATTETTIKKEEPKTSEPAPVTTQVVAEAAPTPLVSEEEPYGNTPNQHYQTIHSLIDTANYDEAERAAESFIEKYPNHPLTANSYYWLAEIHYVRKDFEKAALGFADAYKRFPTHDKAAANILKLGYSLQNLGKYDEACAAFVSILKGDIPAGSNVSFLADNESKKLGCRI